MRASAWSSGQETETAARRPRGGDKREGPAKESRPQLQGATMMTTVCDGNWSKHYRHERLVLSGPAQPEEKQISHGMCERCVLMLDAEMDGIAEAQLAEYGNYLASKIDPRD